MRILYLDIDTLRPDHLSCYGYHRETSPNIDSVAREGMIFERFYASDTPCMPSRAALLTGRFGIHNGIINHGFTASDIKPFEPLRFFNNRQGPLTQLVTLLRRLGYYTVSISPFGERHSAWWYYDGFREMYNSGKGGMETADEVMPLALDWLEKNGKDDNWFLHINIWDPHTPYRTPLNYGNPFDDAPHPSWLKEETLRRHREMYGPHSARTPHDLRDMPEEFFDRYPRLPRSIETPKDYKKWIDGYDTGINYADYWSGKVFDLLKKSGIWEDTLIIISSDHGESQGELNIYGDHQLADEITHRIPLIIKGPGIKEGTVDKELHYNIDLSATLIDLLGGWDLIPEMWDARSFADTIRKGKPCGRPLLVLSHCVWSIQRSIRFDRWLLIETYDDGCKEILTPIMLFDIENDPHELVNLADTYPEVVDRGESLLHQWLKENMAKSLSDEDPLISVLHNSGPYHIPVYQLMDYADTVRSIWGEEKAEEILRRHREQYNQYLLKNYRFLEAVEFSKKYR